MVYGPKGDRAEWRIIYDEARKMSSGDVLTYDKLSELLNRDFRTARTPLQRAMQELENVDKRTLTCVRGAGYRIAAATEHEQLARKHSTRSRRQLDKAAAKARSADRSELSADQVRRLDDLELQFSQHAEILQRLDNRDRKRQDEIRQLRRDHNGTTANLSDQITNIAAALRRHGIPVDQITDQTTASEGPSPSTDSPTSLP